MPIYEYYCAGCNSKFELLRPLTKTNEDVACPKCSKTAKKLLSNFACFSKSAEGITSPISGAGGGCSSCSASSCAGCH